MGETTIPPVDDAEAASVRLEAALARIADGLAKSPPVQEPPPAVADTARLAARLDELIERVRGELAAIPELTAVPGGSGTTD